MTRKRAITTAVCLLLSLIAASVTLPETASRRPVAERVFQQLQEARRAIGRSPFLRHQKLDAAALTRAQEIAQAPKNRRLSRKDSARTLVRAQGLKHLLLIRERIDLQLGSRSPARHVLQRWRNSNDAWEKAMDPRLDLAGCATTRTHDGWIVFVAMLASQQQVPEDLASWSAEVFERINRIRGEHDLPPLKRDPQLDAAALAHSEDMATRSYFAHISPEGSEPGDRVREQERPFFRVGENIAFNRAEPDPIDSAVKGWMNSPGHREHILDPAFRFSGLGIAETTEGGFYFTQLFLEESAQQQAQEKP